VPDEDLDRMKGWGFLGVVGMGVALSGCVATTVLAPPPPAAPTEERPWIGIGMAEPEAGQEGVVVKRVYRTSPADEAGLVAGDVLRGVEGKPVNHPGEVSSALRKKRPGEVVEVTVERKGNPLQVAVKLEPFPGVEEALRRDRVGAAAPELSGLVAVQGTAPLTLAGLRGKVVVLDFWAAWCAVCRKTAPLLNRWHERLEAQGVVVLGVSSDTFGAASRGVASFGIRYPVAVDQGERAFAAYGATSLPTLYVLDRKGVVRAVEVGFSRENLGRVEKLLVELLDEKAP
jgi:peroxiredoxin